MRRQIGNDSAEGFCYLISYLASGGMILVIILFGILLSAPSHATTPSASVIVADACSLTSTNNTPHNATISPNTYQADMGSTTLKASCNDNGGFFYLCGRLYG